jgi:hypothetical protein
MSSQPSESIMKAGIIDAKPGLGFVPRNFNGIVVRACAG